MAALSAIQDVPTSHYWVHVFEAHLNLGYYEKAFSAVMAIVDDDTRQLDSLRQFGLSNHCHIHNVKYALSSFPCSAPILW